MNKRALNRVFKQLNRVINLDNEVIAEGFLVRSVPVAHSLTRDIVEQLATENPSWSEFDLYKAILEPVILQNTANYSGLVAIYDLLARQASIEKREEAYLLHQRTIHYMALRDLEGIKGTGAKEFYLHIVGRSSCCDQCTSLHDTAYTEKEYFANQPIPVPNCQREDQLCACLPNAVSKGRYLRLVEQGRIINHK